MQDHSSSLVGIRQLRLEKAEKLRAMGINPYPNKSKRTNFIAEVVNNFEQFEGKEVTLAGRLMSWREHGHLVFGHIKDQYGQIQLYIHEQDLAPTSTENQNLGYTDLNLIDVGDFVEATGIITKTQRGEISIQPKFVRVLTKAVRPLPEKWKGIQDKEERFRRRYLDMTLNDEVRDRFVRRSKFWEKTREFLNSKGFLEINIPVLEHVTGGADANPFVTHYDALGEDFYLRISHELPLKRLLGGGYDKVYDLGPRFRNEGFSDEHLPEHIAMEWYWAYADYKDGMQLTEELLKFVLKEVYGKLEFDMKGFKVNLDQPWGEIKYVDIVKERFGVDVFNDSVEDMNEVLKKNGINLGEDINRNRVVDNLWKLIRKTIGGPVFLTGLPKFLSPLAKTDPDNVLLTERFHPIIAGSELANAFSELNDPVDQLDRFMEQQGMREAGDAEAHMLDIDFVEMLEYGMPPAVGFGMSERVFWFFEDVSAKEGVPFPQLKFEIDGNTRKVYPHINFDSVKPHREILDTRSEIRGVSSSKIQDKNNRIIIVVNKELEMWQVANTVGHVSAYLGNKLGSNFATGENFVTVDEKNHPRNSQYPIMIFGAKPGQMANFMQTVRQSGLAYHGFIREMLTETDDQKITELLANKKDDEIEYLGIGVFGDNEVLKKLVNKFSLLK